MLRVSTSHEISFQSKIIPHEALLFRSAVIGTNVWIALNNFNPKSRQYSSELVVFDTQALKATNVYCDLFNQTGLGIATLASHNDMLYMMLSYVEQRNNYHLYSLDPKTMNWEFILDVKAILTGKLQFWKGNMYFLDLSMSSLFLVQIDLSSKSVASKTFLKTELHNDMRHQLIENDSLYMIPSSSYPYVVSLTGEVSLSYLDMKRNLEGNFFVYAGFNDTVLSSTKGVWYLEILDFVNEARTNYKIENLNHIIQTVEQVNGIIYILAASFDGFINVDLKVVALKPKLEDLCLIQLVHELAEKDESELNSYLAKLPIQLREKLRTMEDAREKDEPEKVIHDWCGFGRERRPSKVRRVWNYIVRKFK